MIQIFSYNFIFKENVCSKHPARSHNISLLPLRSRSTDASHHNTERQGLQHSAFLRQPPLIMFGPLFLQGMWIAKHISHPAEILETGLWFSSFRPCLPYLRNSPAFPLLQWRISWCWDRAAGQVGVLAVCFVFNTALPRLFNNFRGAQNSLGHWSPIFSFG